MNTRQLLRDLESYKKILEENEYKTSYTYGNNAQIVKRFDKFNTNNSVIPESVYNLAKQSNMMAEIDKATENAAVLSLKVEKRIHIIIALLLSIAFISMLIINTIFSEDKAQTVTRMLLFAPLFVLAYYTFTSVPYSGRKYFGPYYKSFIKTENCSDIQVANYYFELAENASKLSSTFKKFKLDEIINDFDRQRQYSPHALIENKNGDKISIAMEFYDDTLPGFDLSKIDGAFKDANSFIEALEFPFVPEGFKEERFEKKKPEDLDSEDLIKDLLTTYKTIERKHRL